MQELLKKFYFVLLMLIVYRVGTYIPLPGVNATLLTEVVKQNNGGMIGMFNMLTGGALGRLSIFALNIMPYITSSIIIQLMSVISKDIAAMKKEGEAGRRKINQYTRYLTVVLALFQGYGIAVGAESIGANGVSIISHPGWFFRLIGALNLTGGTMFVVWITDQITAYGIGNGSSLVIFAGIVAGLPSAIANMLQMGRSGAISTGFVLSVVVMTVGLVSLIAYVEKAQRRITVNYPKRQVGRKIFGGETTHMPLKLNTSGVIGPIFANSLLLFPNTLLGFSNTRYDVDSWQYFVLSHLNHGRPAYIILYALMIIFFSFFYTSVVFNTGETAENLRKAGAIVAGRRPGTNTAEYLRYVLNKLTFIGALYVSFLCVVPELMIAKYSMPFYLGGTSLLIVVSVVMDMFQQTQMYLLHKRYGSLLKNSALFGKLA